MDEYVWAMINNKPCKILKIDNMGKYNLHQYREDTYECPYCLSELKMVSQVFPSKEKLIDHFTKISIKRIEEEKRNLEKLREFEKC